MAVDIRENEDLLWESTVIRFANLITEFLRKSGNPYYVLVGTRTYFGGTPQGFENTQAIVVMRTRGGLTDNYVDDHSPSVEVKCYGGTSNPADAWNVYGALFDRLQRTENMVLTEGTIMKALEENIPQELIEPDTGYPLVFGAFTIVCRTN